jgi:hypothetical protein
MGTTVTSNLGLIKPDGNESIKANMPTFSGWASQNGNNMDKIDSLFRSDAATTYTVNWTTSTTSPTLGAGGFTEGKYIRLTPRMVIVFFRLYNGGAGFATGSGQYRINAPLQVDPAFAVFSELLPMGKAVFYDISAASTCSAFTVNYSPSSNLMFFRPATGGTWTDAVPVIPAQNDRMTGYFMYPTAVT